MESSKDTILFQVDTTKKGVILAITVRDNFQHQVSESSSSSSYWDTSLKDLTFKSFEEMANA